MAEEHKDTVELIKKHTGVPLAPGVDLLLSSKITVELINIMGSDQDVVSAARVCTGKQHRTHTTSVEKQTAEETGLINFLMKHRHGTPFEHGALTLYVHAPIFVWREWHRHRIGFSYNEESARYKTLEPMFFVPGRDRLMMKVAGWKPGRPKLDPCTDGLRYSQLIMNLVTSYVEGYKAYLANLEMGFDPGLARDCLPVGIYSSCWVTCNPRSLMAFLSLRTHDPDAKFVSYPLAEMEDAARQVENIFAEEWPITYKAFCDNGRVAP